MNDNGTVANGAARFGSPLANTPHIAKPSFGPVLFEAAGDSVRDCLISPCLLYLHDLWRRYPVKGDLPNRDEIDPLDFFHWLPNIMLVDIENDGDRRRFRVRLNGELHVSIAGQSMTGRCFEDIATVRHDEGAVIGVFQSVAESRTPHYWRRKFINTAMRWNAYERCLLPFADDTGEVRTLMAVAQVLEQKE